MSYLTRSNAIIKRVPFTGANMQDSQGCAVFLDNSGKAGLVDDNSVIPFGVILGQPDFTEATDNDEISVAVCAGGLAGTVLVKLVGPVKAGDLLMSNFGLAEKAAGTGRYVYAQALETGVDSELIEAVLFRPYQN